MIRIKKAESRYEREALTSPFGFKGKYVDELWQIIVFLESEEGSRGIGLGVQSVLWSDSRIFAKFGSEKGNKLMLQITEYALWLVEGISFETPVDLLEHLLPYVYEYGKKITNNDKLSKTFVLNALVALDNAAWQLFFSHKGTKTFDDLTPEKYRPALMYRNTTLASIPLISYGVTKEDILKLVDEGYFFFKIKIGSDPEKDGDLNKMLEWDKKRLKEIHELLRNIHVPYTNNGYVPYYLDANGRYDSKDRLFEFLDFAGSIGALDRIIMLEEPFPENYKASVWDVPVRVAADESAHSVEDTIERIELGYGAIALKPMAKTLSMSFKIAQEAFHRGIPCFCADLTVNPVMVDWNKNVAARLMPLPGMEIGILESNGPQNYKSWSIMKGYHPCCGEKWIETIGGVFDLNKGFYEKGGGIFQVGEHYTSLFNIKE